MRIRRDQTNTDQKKLISFEIRRIRSRWNNNLFAKHIRYDNAIISKNRNKESQNDKIDSKIIWTIIVSKPKTSSLKKNLKSFNSIEDTSFFAETKLQVDKHKI